MKLFLAVIILATITLSAAHADDYLHPKIQRGLHLNRKLGSAENENKFWQQKAQNTLQEKLRQTLNTNVAKNVILFLGDGMSIPTLAATRSYQGERAGKPGTEGERLFFETFPHSGLSQTYCVDLKVADSACSATAYLGGVKGNEGTIGVNGNVARGDCQAMRDPANHVYSIAKWFQDEGLATGLVTTTRVTHASPAGVYAHVADRDWENDLDVINHNQDSDLCDDIARQLVKTAPGSNLNVVMGGGRSGFLPKDDGGYRQDGENLTETWKKNKSAKNESSVYITDRDHLLSLSTLPDNILGLFNKDHMDYHFQNNTEEPTLEEMTETAIKVLQKSGNGFFLFVEGGKIDLAHHGNQARMALDETLEFAKAIAKAASMTDETDTLIVVTADHAHTMSYAGYTPRENSILEFAGTGSDNKPYMTLSYSNGPGFKIVNGGRPDLSKEDIGAYDYAFPAGVPLGSETHGGDDVAVFANGPWSHLFASVFEENFIPHAMAFASCVGSGLTVCNS